MDENKYTKYATISIAVITLIIGLVLIYSIIVQQQLIATLAQNTQEQRVLQGNITAVQAALLPRAEFDQKIASLNMDMDAIKKDLKETHSQITSAIIASNSTPGTVIINGGGGKKPIPTTDPQACPVNNTTGNDNEPCYKDPYGNFSKVSTLNLTENVGSNKDVPLGLAEFHPTRQNPWDVQIFPRKYTTSVLIASNDEGIKTAYAKMSITSNDLTIDLPQTQVSYYEKLPTPKFTLWNPRFLVGFDVGWNLQKNSFSDGLIAQAYISSYGALKQVPVWYIGGIGVSYDINNSSYNVAFSPFAYKVTSNNSIIHNITTAPTIMSDIHGNISIVGGFRVAL